MPNTTIPAAETGLPYETLAEIHDDIYLALDIAENRCPFPEEACELMREALGHTKALLERTPAPRTAA